MKKAKHKEYGEKTIKKTYTVTPTASKLLQELAKEMGVSASHLIEKIARREIALAPSLGES